MVKSPTDAPSIPLSAHFDQPAETFNAVTWLNTVLSTEPTPSLPLLLDLLDDDMRDLHVTLDNSLKTALQAVP